MSVKKHFYKNRPEWVDLRNKLALEGLQIGASDCAAAVGKSKYKSPINVFYDLLGIHKSSFESLRMSLGLLEEMSNKACYEAYVPDEYEFAVNIKDGIKLNKIRSCNFIAVSSDFPIIAASLDFERHKGQPALVDTDMFAVGETIPFAYPIDTKNMNSDYWRHCKGKLPETYKIQAYAQMIATETTYAEMSIKIDALDYKILGVPYEQRYGDWLKTELTSFWKRVLQAKPMAELLLEARKEGNTEDEALYTSMIAALEPPLTGTEAEIEFLNELYGDTQDAKLAPTEESLILALRYDRARKVEKTAQGMKDDVKSKLIHFLHGNEIVEDAGYKVIHRNKNGKEYFSVKVK